MTLAKVWSLQLARPRQIKPASRLRSAASGAKERTLAQGCGGSNRTKRKGGSRLPPFSKRIDSAQSERSINWAMVAFGAAPTI